MVLRSHAFVIMVVMMFLRNGELRKKKDELLIASLSLSYLQNN
jgi:hypothetical protein